MLPRECWTATILTGGNMFKIQKIYSDIEPLNRLQDQIIKQSNELDIPLIRGNLITDISFNGAETKKIPHKLGKNYTGYFIVKKNANQNVFDNDVIDGEFLTLTSTGTCKISLWVF